MQFKLASLTYKPTKSYTPVLRHICLNASIPFLLAPCDHPPPLTCTSFALIFLSVHARFILQFQQSGMLFLLLFDCLKTWTLSEYILKTIFSRSHLKASLATCPVPLIYSTEWLWCLIKFYNLLTYLLSFY